MSKVRVLDTGVVIGTTIDKNQHYKNCSKYIQSGNTTYTPPTTDQEYQKRESHIRDTLAEEIRHHREDVINEVDKGTISEGTFKWIRDNLLDPNYRSFTYLYEYYNNKISESRFENILRLQLSYDLDDMSYEVYDDASKDLGGLRSITVPWTSPIPQYPSVESALLLNGNDRQICIEAHHIALNCSSDVELATTNPKDFIEHRPGEPVSREDNILNCTDIATNEDLSYPKFP